jgi:hypothetical protein
MIQIRFNKCTPIFTILLSSTDDKDSGSQKTHDSTIQPEAWGDSRAESDTVTATRESAVCRHNLWEAIFENVIAIKRTEKRNSAIYYPGKIEN